MAWQYTPSRPGSEYDTGAALQQENRTCVLLLDSILVRFHRNRHPREINSTDVSSFLTFLAVKRRVSASTQNQALNAIVFLYRRVLEVPLDDIENVIRTKQSRRIPVVMSREKIRQVFRFIQQPYLLMAGLMYGSGLRVMKTLRLRIKDIDFDRRVILVRAGKGNKDRVTILPDTLEPDIKNAIARAGTLHKRDIAEGFGEVKTPYALAKKYPGEARSLHWRFLFAADRRSRDPVSGDIKRHHIFETSIQRAVKHAVVQAQIGKPASCHTFLKMVMTYAQYRNSSGTMMLRQPRSILTLSNAAEMLCAVLCKHWGRCQPVFCASASSTLSSGTQDPQLVPAFSASPICSTLVRFCVCIASTSVLMPTLKQAHTICPASFCPTAGLPMSRLVRAATSSGPCSNSLDNQSREGRSIPGPMKMQLSSWPSTNLAAR